MQLFRPLIRHFIALEIISVWVVVVAGDGRRSSDFQMFIYMRACCTAFRTHMNMSANMMNCGYNWFSYIANDAGELVSCAVCVRMPNPRASHINSERSNPQKWYFNHFDVMTVANGARFSLR